MGRHFYWALYKKRKFKFSFPPFPYFGLHLQRLWHNADFHLWHANDYQLTDAKFDCLGMFWNVALKDDAFLIFSRMGVFGPLLKGITVGQPVFHGGM